MIFGIIDKLERDVIKYHDSESLWCRFEKLRERARDNRIQQGQIEQNQCIILSILQKRRQNAD